MSKNIKNCNGEIKESELVYEALKNSALHCEDGIRTARIYMYAVYFLLIAFGFNYRWMFLVSFFVLIAFQSMMNNDRIAGEVSKDNADDGDCDNKQSFCNCVLCVFIRHGRVSPFFLSSILYNV